MNATRSLPEHYRQDGSLDLSKNFRAMVVLNLVSIPLFALFGTIFVGALYLIRPGESASGLSMGIESASNLIVLIGALILLTVLVLILHEGFHALFFWLFTRNRPAFGIGSGYAYATAPGWYFPRWQYFIIGLAPLVGISALGLALLAFIPPGWFLTVLAFMTLNAAGAVGDLAVCLWLLRKPRGVLVEDRGDAVSFYVST